MSVKWLAIFLWAICGFGLPASAQQQLIPRAQAPARASSGECTIAGVVTNAVTGKPIEHAWVTLSQYQAAGHVFPPPFLDHEALTDAQGHFEIRQVLNSNFQMGAGKNGYVPWGLELNGCPRRPGSAPHRLSIRLMPAGVISGRVTDAEGRPLVYARVEALKVAYTNRGPRPWPAREYPFLTDDRGDYRIFGLKPGSYFVLVTYFPGPSPFGFTFPQNASSSLPLAFPFGVLYPSTRRISKAKELVLAPGQQISGIDFRLAAGRTYQVSGTVAGTAELGPGSPPSVSATICGNGHNEGLGNMAGPLPEGPSGAVGPNGEFLVRNLLPGCYDLWAEGTTAAGTERMAKLRVAVPDHDVGGLRLRLAKLPDVPVQIVAETPAVAQNVAVFLEGEDGAAVDAVEGKHGSLVIRRVPPGSYRFGALGSSLPPDWYVKSAELGGRDILDQRVQILSGQSPGSLQVVLANDGAELSGAVEGPGGKPAKGAFVVLVPASPLRGVTCLYKSATTDSSGRYKIQGIRPGSYTLFAWDDASYQSWYDPAFLSAMEGRGVRLNLAEGQHEVLPLRSITVPLAEGGLP